MCGLAGVVCTKSTSEGELQQQLQRMQRVLYHRGPDDRGTWIRTLQDERLIGLASTRLAILDLSPAGHMPMSTMDGRYTIVYNGEIYNYPELRRHLESKGYRFVSRSDTEAVLYMYQEYGPECVARLNGMFAIALWDSPQQRLFLARDHFGVKPLYYTEQAGNLAFASEVKSLFELPWVAAEPDFRCLKEFLTFTWVPDPDTLFRGVCKLPAGHYAIFREGRIDVTQYWDLRFPPAGSDYPRSEQELAREIAERFRESVRSQMLSDVPIGAFLSAGMDSSSIVAMMAQATGTPVRTYTITFPGKYRVGENALDDPNVARLMAQKYGCEHHEIVVEPEVTDLLPHLVWHMDEPIADPAIILAYLVCRHARETVTVLLSGVGGDELFAGYRKHYAQRWAEAYRRLPVATQAILESVVQRLPAMRGARLKGPIRLLKKMARSGALPPRQSFLMNCTYFDGDQQARLFTDDLQHVVHGYDPYAKHVSYFDRVSEADFLNQMLYLDTKAFMPSLNLTYNDKMSMASSVEVRVPFLDHQLADFVAQNVPPHLKIQGCFRPQTKYILRTAMDGALPKEVLTQPKAGFGAPVDYWLAHDLRGMVDDLLSETQVRSRGLFQPKVVKRFVDEHRSGKQDWSMQIWQLLTFELWMQTFVDRAKSRDSVAEASARS